MPCMNQHRHSGRRSRTVFPSRTHGRCGTRRPGNWVPDKHQEMIAAETWASIRRPAARPAHRAARSQRPRAAWLGSRTRFPHVHSWDMSVHSPSSLLSGPGFRGGQPLRYSEYQRFCTENRWYSEYLRGCQKFQLDRRASLGGGEPEPLGQPSTQDARGCRWPF